MSGTPKPSFSGQDQERMSRALELARRAAAAGEVPVGALLVDGEGRILGEGSNGPIAGADPSAHAEILALRAAGQALGVPRLVSTTLYVTLEPCLMCLGAMVHARISRLVYAARDPKVGATERFADLPGLNHRFSIEGGLLADESAELLRAFFRERR